MSSWNIPSRLRKLHLGIIGLGNQEAVVSGPSLDRRFYDNTLRMITKGTNCSFKPLCTLLRAVSTPIVIGCGRWIVLGYVARDVNTHGRRASVKDLGEDAIIEIQRDGILDSAEHKIRRLAGPQSAFWRPAVKLRCGLYCLGQTRGCSIRNAWGFAFRFDGTVLRDQIHPYSR